MIKIKNKKQQLIKETQMIINKMKTRKRTINQKIMRKTKRMNNLLI